MTSLETLWTASPTVALLRHSKGTLASQWRLQMKVHEVNDKVDGRSTIHPCLPRGTSEEFFVLRSTTQVAEVFPCNEKSKRSSTLAPLPPSLALDQRKPKVDSPQFFYCPRDSSGRGDGDLCRPDLSHPQDYRGSTHRIYHQLLASSIENTSRRARQPPDTVCMAQ